MRKFATIIFLAILFFTSVRLHAQSEAAPYIKTNDGNISRFDEVKFGDYHFIGYLGEKTTKVARNDVSSALVSKGSLKNKSDSKEEFRYNQILRRKVKRTGKMQYEISVGKSYLVVFFATEDAVLVGGSSAGGSGLSCDMFYLIEGNKATLLRFRKEEHYNLLVKAFNKDEKVLEQIKLLYEEKGIATRMYTYLSAIRTIYMTEYYLEL